MIGVLVVEVEGRVTNRVRLRRQAISNVERIAGGEITTLIELRRPLRRE
ncbi:MAG: hypothetical protein H8K09_11705 [Nitrospira sp.]|jgi:hypothetical protein|nr:hypothetical protein [Nitrospira sp.]